MPNCQASTHDYDHVMEDIAATLFSSAEPLALPSGAFLFHARDRVQFVHLIDVGTICLERVQKSGQTTCFQRAKAGDVLAEASVYAQEYHCDARALNDVSFRRVRRDEFRRHLDERPSLANAWAAHLARTVQRTRLNAEIRSLKTVRERLDVWIGEYGELPVKGQWLSLADELAVSREALYRELSKRRSTSGY